MEAISLLNMEASLGLCCFEQKKKSQLEQFNAINSTIDPFEVAFHASYKRIHYFYQGILYSFLTQKKRMKEPNHKGHTNKDHK